jgi:hypothetical protein
MAVKTRQQTYQQITDGYTSEEEETESDEEKRVNKELEEIIDEINVKDINVPELPKTKKKKTSPKFQNDFEVTPIAYNKKKSKNKRVVGGRENRKKKIVISDPKLEKEEEEDVDVPGKKKKAATHEDLMLETNIILGERVTKNNTILNEILKYIKLQTVRQRQEQMQNMKERNLRRAQTQHRIDGRMGAGYRGEVVDGEKFIKRFCLFQAIFCVAAFFIILTIILTCGLTWMNISPEVCVYLCLLCGGVLVVLGALNLFLFCCMKKFCVNS